MFLVCFLRLFFHVASNSRLLSMQIELPCSFGTGITRPIAQKSDAVLKTIPALFNSA